MFQPFSKFFLSLLLLMTCLAGKIPAQVGTGFETFTTSQGLSQGMINDMIQDKEGFIWIATKGGLNRFDGYNFKIFTNDPQDSNSISSNSISSLLEDGKGRLWIGTSDAGVNVYNKKTGHFLRINQLSGLSGNKIESIMTLLPDGRIMASSKGSGMNIISLDDAGKVTVSKLPIPDNRVAAWLFKDEKGFTWVQCEDGAMYVSNPVSQGFDLLYDGRRFTSLIEKTGKLLSGKFSQGIAGNFSLPAIADAYIDSLGQLKLSSDNYNAKGELLLEGRFPLKTGAMGLNFYDFSGVKPGDNIDKIFGRSFGIRVKKQNIRCILLDRSGVLWIGTMGHGIYKYPIISQRFHQLLPGMSIQRFNVWNKDRIYVQGWDRSEFLNGEGKNIANPVAGLVTEAVAYTPVIQAKNGDHWVYWNAKGTLYQYSASLKLLNTYEKPVSDAATDQLQPSMEDSRGRIWLCGINGSLARIDVADNKLEKFTVDIARYTGATGLTQTNAFYEDANGIFWLATENGFGRLEFNGSAAPKTTWYKNIPGDDQSLNYNYVSWFVDDPADKNYLWVATKGGGINRLDKSTGKFIHFTTKDGLPNNVVYGLLADKKGNLWGSTNRGLFCMLARKNNEPPAFRLFSTSDGLQADEFNTNALAKLSDGRLVFGGVNGMNIFDPEKVLTSNFSPGVYITGLQIGNKNILPGDESGVLKQTIEQTASITLTHLQDVITFEFASLDFTASPQNKYRYQLVGIDKEWVEAGTRRNATYLHLPAGNYVFKVQGSNSQGIWSENIAELKIKVLPPWWLSWWAYIIYALLLAILIRAWLKFNVNKAKLRSQLNFEQLEAKRVKELDTIKTQLYTNITHEFRTPLTVILGMTQQVIDKPTEQFDSRMEMILRNGRSLFNLVNEMLDLSKLETGKMHLQLSQGDVIGFLRYVVESFHSLAGSQQKQLHFLSDIDVLYLEYDREKMRQIVSNLLSNAIKFTPEKGNIYINVMENLQRIESDLSTLIIKVKDTGIGIPEDKLQHIFDRFYQLDNSHTRQTEGTGIGLALTKELVKLMEGEIIVKSPPTGAGKGTEFTVLLPLKKVAPVKGELHDIYSEERPVIGSSVISTADLDESKKDAPLILLVEDNPDVVAYTASCLPDYRLAVGKDGREGFEIAIQETPDLIITDVMMPFVDGFELLEQLRSNEYSSHIPVIMLTAKADIQSRIEGLQRGADVYLEKPFNKQELIVRIQKLLEMRKQLQQYYLKQAGIENNNAKQVMIAEDEPGIIKIIADEKTEDAFVKKVREAVEQHLTDVSFSVEKLCKLVFMSHSQLHRKLDALTGCSPNKFIRMIRLKKAKELLADPSSSIASVALDCGYADPGYFARVFKQEYGVTPVEWRMGER